MAEPIGIALVGGPPALNGWRQVYDLGTDWPPPDEIVAFERAGTVAIALPEMVPDGYEFDGDVARYRKIDQSTLDAPTDVIVRGAKYEAIR
jgi:hypothetical protein